MSDRRQNLIDCIGEELECLPLAESVLRGMRGRLEATSLETLEEIWASRDEWANTIARRLL